MVPGNAHVWLCHLPVLGSALGEQQRTTNSCPCQPKFAPALYVGELMSPLALTGVQPPPSWLLQEPAVTKLRCLSCAPIICITLPQFDYTRETSNLLVLQLWEPIWCHWLQTETFRQSGHLPNITNNGSSSGIISTPAGTMASMLCGVCKSWVISTGEL